MGTLSTKRTDLSNIDTTMKLSGVTHCVHWDDGVGLIGWSSDGTQGSPWITKLDVNGAKLWSTQIHDLPAGRRG